MKRALIQPKNKPYKRNVNTGHKDRKCNGCAVEDLIADAGRVDSEFEELFNYFVSHTKADTGIYKLWFKPNQGKDASGNKIYYETPYGRILLDVGDKPVTSYGRLKGAPRIEQKCFTKYREQSSATGIVAVRYVNDVARGTICYKNCLGMIGALGEITKWDGMKPPGTKIRKYQVVRIKQIYEPKSPLLYGDVKMNIQVTTSTGIKHNCELQLNHLDMIKAKGTKDGHGAYEAWRNMDDDHWQKEGKELPPKIANMKEDYRAKALKIVHKSQSAYNTSAAALSRDPNYQKLLNMVRSWGDQIKSDEGLMNANYDNPPN
ncbi:MAG: hypothetical protein MI802_09635 [Desulfobacterales bacterium]|nr:hypothetical protein [Desulfobacterales bacterium]